MSIWVIWGICSAKPGTANQIYAKPIGNLANGLGRSFRSSGGELFEALTLVVTIKLGRAPKYSHVFKNTCVAQVVNTAHQAVWARIGLSAFHAFL